MALSREEQARIVRIIASMKEAGFTLKEALLSLARDYEKSGFLELPPELQNYFPKKWQKGWISEVFEGMASEIDSGKKEEEVIAEAEEIFDEDVRLSLASAFSSGNVEKLSNKLADLMELEIQLLGKLKKVAIGPAIAIVIGILFTYVMVFLVTPKFVAPLTHKEALPITVKIAYFLSQHFWSFTSGVIGLLALTYFFLKSGIWKNYLPAYSQFEKLRFLNWLKILLETGWSEVKTFQFLLEAGFSKKWREAIEEALYNLEAGESLDKAMELFVERGLLGVSDFSFIKSGVKAGNVPKLIEPILRFLAVTTDKDIEKTSTLIQTFFLIVVGIYVIALYLGIFLPLTTAVQKAV